jgi:hypothetical protein
MKADLMDRSRRNSSLYTVRVEAFFWLELLNWLSAMEESFF